MPDVCGHVRLTHTQENCHELLSHDLALFESVDRTMFSRGLGDGLS